MQVTLQRLWLSQQETCHDATLCGLFIPLLSLPMLQRRDSWGPWDHSTTHRRLTSRACGEGRCRARGARARRRSFFRPMFRQDGGDFVIDAQSTVDHAAQPHNEEQAQHCAGAQLCPPSGVAPSAARGATTLTSVLVRRRGRCCSSSRVTRRRSTVSSG